MHEKINLEKNYFRFLLFENVFRCFRLGLLMSLSFIFENILDKSYEKLNASVFPNPNYIVTLFILLMLLILPNETLLISMNKQ